MKAHTGLRHSGSLTRLLVLMGVIALALMLCSPRTARIHAAQQAVADPAIEAQVRRLSAELRCPVCQALSLADSPSELSEGMKDVIRAQLQAGRTPEEVKAYFVSRYGEWILLKPEPRGWNVLVYALPVLLVGGGLIGVFWLTRRWTATAAQEAGDSAAARSSGNA